MADDKKRIGRPSQIIPGNKTRPIAPPENTYRLQPPRIFNRWKAEPLLKYMLDDALKAEKYSHDNIRTICRELTHNVKNKMMALNYNRYKIVVILVVGQNSRGGGVNVATRALMHMQYDGYASATFRNNDVFATMLVYFLNYE